MQPQHQHKEAHHGRGSGSAAFAQSPGQHFRSKSNATGFTGSAWAPPRDTYGDLREAPQAQDPNDPFVDSGYHHQSKQTPYGNYTAVFPSTPQARSVASSSDANSSYTPGRGDHRSNAARLAQAIKSGIYENVNAPAVREYQGPSRHTSTRRGPIDRAQGELVVQQQQPLVNVQALITPDIIANPSFFANLARGYRPTVEEAFEHIPFIEQARHAKPAAWGVIKIGNVSSTCS